MVNSSEIRGRDDKSSLKSAAIQKIIYFYRPGSRQTKYTTEQNINK